MWSNGYFNLFAATKLVKDGWALIADKTVMVNQEIHEYQL